jgi:hypothetical protein
MKSNLTKLAVAAGALTLCATGSAMAGSTSEQGEGVGGAPGAPLPPGIFFIEEDNWGVRDTSPGNNKSTLGVNINALVWSTPWTVAGARVMFVGVIPNAEAGNTNLGGGGATYAASLFNPFLGGTLAWNLGNGFNFSYTLAGYVPLKGDAVADPDGDIENRIGLSYLKDGWNLSTEFRLGTHLTNETLTGHPDYLNIEMTGTKQFGKWTLGPIAYFSTDTQNELLNPATGFMGKQSQFAVGGLVGYDWGQLVTQVYVSRDVYEQNYGGYDTRVWGRLIVPLGDPFAPTSTGGPMFRKTQ